MKFQDLGYKTQDAYFEEFFSTLLDSNRSAEFYVHWDKVYAHVAAHLDEISLLNGLVNIADYGERKKHFEQVITKYPATRGILPLIIATRDVRLDVLQFTKDGSVSYLNLDFNKSPVKTIMDFCEEARIIELLGKVKDLHSYLTGVEVGMDTNARKNRSGTVFEDLVLKGLKKNGIDARKPTEKIDLARNKTPDLVIYKNGKPFAIVEANFFNETGSKPLETIQAYITLQRAARDKNIRFILVTDGPSWKGGKGERVRAFEQLDYPMNFRLAMKLIPKMVG